MERELVTAGEAIIGAELFVRIVALPIEGGSDAIVRNHWSRGGGSRVGWEGRVRYGVAPVSAGRKPAPICGERREARNDHDRGRDGRQL